MGFDKTTAGWQNRFHKQQSQYFLSQEFQPILTNIFGEDGVTPIAKLTWSNRDIEANCSEKMKKKSIMFKKEFQKTPADMLI